MGDVGAADRAAAMEPGHEDRENLDQDGHTVRPGKPQWSPVTRTGKTRRGRTPAGPGWRRNGARSRRPGNPDLGAARAGSPCRRNGARSRGPGRHVGAPGPGSKPTASQAAMEPGLEDRENVGPALSASEPVGVAAMEPGHEDRENLPSHARRSPRSRAAMEPGHEDREDRRSLRTSSPSAVAAMEPGHEDRESAQVCGSRFRWRCRNGARSRRPETLRAACARGARDRRNGARSRRPENTTRPSPSTRGRARRNGARSRRPGRLTADELRRRLSAAMEPGHEDRENRPDDCRKTPLVRPQWSPVTKTGKTGGDPTTIGKLTRRNGARSRRPGRPTVTADDLGQ